MRIVARDVATALSVALLLVACGDESDPRNAVEVAPATSPCEGANCGAPETQEPELVGKRTPQADGGDDDVEPEEEEPTVAPPSENTCETAIDLGSMAGEGKNYASEVETFSAQGKCSTWVKIRVNETHSGLIPMQVEAILVSSSTKKFDLLGYVNKDKDEVECATPEKTSASTVSSVDTVKLTWGDSWGSSDSRTVTFQVKSRDGQCDASNNWSLVVKSVLKAAVSGQ